jgi:Protein of unknown function (DUF4242)
MNAASLPKWRNWQTRMIQGHVPARVWGFESPLRHHRAPTLNHEETAMPRYVIERDIPNAGNLSDAELQSISQKSCSVLNKLGPTIQWVHSYVTDNKIYCVYIAPNEQMVREHAKQGGFPANRVSEVRNVIDPTTAEA